MRVTYSRADVGKITEYRENKNSAFQKLEVRHKSQFELNILSDTLLASISYEYRPKLTNVQSTLWISFDAF